MEAAAWNPHQLPRQYPSRGHPRANRRRTERSVSPLETFRIPSSHGPLRKLRSGLLTVENQLVASKKLATTILRIMFPIIQKPAQAKNPSMRSFKIFPLVFSLILPAPALLAQVLVNQSGYNTADSKRFTAPLAADGTPFSIITDPAGTVVFTGTVNGGVGDFSAFQPAATGNFRVLLGTAPTSKVARLRHRPVLDRARQLPPHGPVLHRQPQRLRRRDHLERGGRQKQLRHRLAGFAPVFLRAAHAHPVVCREPGRLRHRPHARRGNLQRPPQHAARRHPGNRPPDPLGRGHLPARQSEPHADQGGARLLPLLLPADATVDPGLALQRGARLPVRQLVQHRPRPLELV